MKTKRKDSTLNLILRACKQYIKTSKKWGVLEQGISIAHALSLVGNLLATQLLFDAITLASEGGLSFWQVVAPLGVLAIATVLQQFFSGARSFIFDELSYSNTGRYIENFQLKLSRIPAKNFENTKFLDNVNRAKDFVESEELGHFTNVVFTIFTHYFVYFASVGLWLFWLSPVLSLVIVAAFIPAILGQLMQVKIFSELEEKNAPLRRQNDYYKKAITDREFFKETRLLGGFKFFHRLFIDTLKIVTQKTWKAQRHVAILRIMLSLASFLGLGLSIFMLFNAVMAGDISIGAFAAIFAALSQIFALMDEIVNRHLSGGSERLGQLKNYYQLLDYEEVTGQTGLIIDFEKGVVANGVSFTYPEREVPAVQNVTFSIKNGETIAIVGENGAGKSTLVRLLIGLYLPDCGTVKIGGLDSKKTHSDTVFASISGVFQRYQRYKMTLAENVAVSDTSHPIMINDVHSSLSEAEFNEETATLDTMLSPEFDGIDLSGGQWQRLAIARGLYRTSEFIVLDEPTASIDPIEEERIYNQFKYLSKDKCAIVVTHRLGSAKLADRIVVMNNGEITDIGTHDELLSRKGKYSDMWKAQTSWYEISS
jgi:ATP-binding cassette subfamily B protein